MIYYPRNYLSTKLFMVTLQLLLYNYLDSNVTCNLVYYYYYVFLLQILVPITRVLPKGWQNMEVEI